MARKRQRVVDKVSPQKTLKRFMVDGHNPVTGELEVPIINFWKTKEGVFAEDNVGGAVRSGTEIEIIRRDKDGWIYLTCSIEWKGETYLQRGFVRHTLVKELGAFANG